MKTINKTVNEQDFNPCWVEIRNKNNIIVDGNFTIEDLEEIIKRAKERENNPES